MGEEVLRPSRRNTVGMVCFVTSIVNYVRRVGAACTKIEHGNILHVNPGDCVFIRHVILMTESEWLTESESLITEFLQSRDPISRFDEHHVMIR